MPAPLRPDRYHNRYHKNQGVTRHLRDVPLITPEAVVDKSDRKRAPMELLSLRAKRGVKPMAKRSVSFSRDGSFRLNFETIGSIGIDNIIDLKSHSISRIGNRVMHLIEFNAGGTCEVTFLITSPTNARLELFQGTGIAVRGDGTTVYIRQAPSAPRLRRDG